MLQSHCLPSARVLCRLNKPVCAAWRGAAARPPARTMGCPGLLGLMQAAAEDSGQGQLATAADIAAKELDAIFHDPACQQFNSRRVGGDVAEEAIAGLAPVAAICGAAQQARLRPPKIVVSAGSWDQLPDRLNEAKSEGSPHARDLLMQAMTNHTAAPRAVRRWRRRPAAAAAT